MNKSYWVIVIGASCILIYLIYLNRAHAKIQEAMIITITGLIAVVFGVGFFGGENEEINKIISAVSFISLEQKKPAFFNVHILRNYQMYQFLVWSEFEKNNPDLAIKAMEKLGSFVFRVGEFERDNLSAKELVGEIMKGLKVSEEIPESEEEAVEWLNESILPYKIFNNTLLSKESQSFLAQIRKNYGKEFSAFSDEELKELAEMPKGHKIKRSILRVLYPLKIPKNQKLPEGIEELNLLTELFAITIIKYLGSLYTYNWDIIMLPKTAFPGFTLTRGQGLNTSPKDKKIFTSEKLMEIFKKNTFHKSLKQTNQLTLPKGTTLKYIPPSGEFSPHQIIISKKFAFTATINLSPSFYSPGLGEVASYIEITDPTNSWNVNSEECDKFATTGITIDCNIKFFSFKSGNPKVLTYRKWLKNLFKNLHEEFDWSVCNNAMKEYKEELAHQKIISDPGKGSGQKKTGEAKNFISKQVTINKSSEEKEE